MFYNCPVRKLASHSPPSCEKNNTQPYTVTGPDTHSLTQIHLLAYTHTRGHIQTQTHLLTQAPLVPYLSGEHEAAGRGGGGQCCLSLSLYKSAGICTHGLAKSVSTSALGTLPPPLPLCSGSWLQSTFGRRKASGHAVVCVHSGPAGTPVPGESSQGLGV